MAEPAYRPRPRTTAPDLSAGESLFFHAGEFYSSLEKDLRCATESICMEMYIWSNDSLGRHFFQLLEEAAARNVRVRVLLDGVGSFFWIRSQRQRLHSSAVEVHVWRPVTLGGLRPRGIPQAFSRLNRRNHKKVTLIDNRIAYTGSLNISQSSLAWKESGVRISGTPVRQLHDLFEDAWERSAGWHNYDIQRSFRLQASLLRSKYIRSNQGYLLRRTYLRSLRRRIHKSQSRVWLMTPYFVPTFGLFLSILQAARRGVDVRVLLPRKNDIWFLRWVASLYYRYMLKAGVKIYEFLPSILHAKATLIDNWGAIGSGNLNRRSAHLDLELDLVLSAPSVRRLEREFSDSFERSEQILQYVPMGRARRWIARLFYFLRGWL